MATLSPVLSVPHGLDDLVHINGALVVTGFATGQLIRVDVDSGVACTLVSGLSAPTSVRVPVGFAGFDPGSEVVVTEASGRILRVVVG